MKKLVLVLVACCMLTCCTRSVENRPNVTIRGQVMPSPRASLRPECVFTIDECEYYVVTSYLSFTYVHKGNCKNPIHPENWPKEKWAGLLK